MIRLRLLLPLLLLLLHLRPAVATGRHTLQGEPAMSLISRPMLAPVVSNAPTVPDHGLRPSDGIVRVRRSAQDVQDVPAEAAQAETPEAPAEAVQDATDTAPVTRADLARLETTLVRHLETRDEALSRLEDVCLTLLQEIDALRQRFDRWDAEDAEAAAY